MAKRLMTGLILLAGVFTSDVAIAETNLPAKQSPVLLRPPRKPVSIATGSGGMVACETPLASEIGCQILREGGSAVDAAVAVAVALQVTWPEAGNLGGGGFMMISPVEGSVQMIDYRERAPLSIDAHSMAKLENKLDIRFVGTPGSLRGLELAHQKHGRLPWADLIKPSIALARDGFVVDAALRHSINWCFATLADADAPRFAELHRVYGHPNGRPWLPGDRLVQPDLANTLEAIANQGADAFYNGEVGDALLAEMMRQKGWVTQKDLRSYYAQERKPIHCTFQGHDVFVPELPSAASVVIPMQLGMIERSGLKKSPSNSIPWTVDHVHQISEVMRRAFRTRAAHLGDRDFVAVPMDLTSGARLNQLVAHIRPDAATSSTELAGDIPMTDAPYESEQTTHFSILDADGMGVSNTTTIEQNFGSRIVVRGAGFLLNNQMGDFNRKPGYTNRQGTIGTLANQIAPGKRMLSSMSPTIVKKDGKIRLLVGSPGGRTILNTVTLILVQRLMMDRTLAEAVDNPRFHHQWFPDEIQFEGDHLDAMLPLAKELNDRGHSIKLDKRDRQGAVHAIEWDPRTRAATGVSDWRRGGGVKAVAQRPAD